ncbi:hypothetical protein BpHYR1_001696 [Brachionus plicatilis]|uniref:Uncharacterized protein n=1 Tax=Brachionus plicatilis TaxID=10195 RepID=A0A3M7SZP8_BRAPC|nr:hypothetical protein BpHYR1_001696 [Brachionus plicatilis]
MSKALLSISPDITSCQLLEDKDLKNNTCHIIELKHELKVKDDLILNSVGTWSIKLRHHKTLHFDIFYRLNYNQAHCYKYIPRQKSFNNCLSKPKHRKLEMFAWI